MLTMHILYRSLALGCLMAGIAAAQSVSIAAEPSPTNSDTSGEQIAEITVTAQKRSERLSDVPISVTAVVGEQLVDLGITTPAQLAEVTPGFDYRPSAYGHPIYQIRGVGFFEESFGISPTVSVYVDQVPLPFSIETEGAGFDVERVEVLKGPQGTLFGQNATGGAINYIANKPTDTFEGGIDVGYGNYNATSLSGFVGGPLTDKLKVRFAFEHDSRGDWQKSYASIGANGYAHRTNGNQQLLGQQDISKGRFLVDYQATDNIDVELNFNGWFDRSDTQAMQDIGWAPINSTLQAPIPYVAQVAAYPLAPNDATYAGWNADQSLQKNDNFYQGSARVNAKLGNDMTLTSITAYSHARLYEPIDDDGTQYSNMYVVSSGKLSSVSEELRLAGLADGDALKWMIGGTYEHDSTYDNQSWNFSQGGTNTVFCSPPIPGLIGGGECYYYNGGIQYLQQAVNTGGLFGSLDYKPVDTVTIYGSSRYTISNRNATACLNDNGDGTFATAFSAVANLAELLENNPPVIANNHIPPGGCFTEASASYAKAHGVPVGSPITSLQSKLDEHNISWRVGADWKPIPELLLYANAAKGYKSGTFADITIVTTGQENPVPQESVLAYEAGFKEMALNRSLLVTGAIFHMDYKDKQLAGTVLTPPFGYLPTIISIPTSKVDGAELDLTWHLLEGLTLHGGASYIDSKVTSHIIQSNVHYGSPPLIDLYGMAFPGASKWQGDLDATYERPINSQWNWFAGASSYYQTMQHAAFTAAALNVIPEYGLLNALAGFERADHKYRVEFWGRNVLNKFYVLDITNIQDTIGRAAGMPATYGVNFGARFR
jgi:iron complex outermembrane receptor protein